MHPSALPITAPQPPASTGVTYQCPQPYASSANAAGLLHYCSIYTCADCWSSACHTPECLANHCLTASMRPPPAGVILGQWPQASSANAVSAAALLQHVRDLRHELLKSSACGTRQCCPHSNLSHQSSQLSHRSSHRSSQGSAGHSTAQY